ncbi:MAG TPA: peptidase M15 [Ruminococcaceae bacterium]|nr:peptidase M15 [Oscillospiraceae bacterium]
MNTIKFSKDKIYSGNLLLVNLRHRIRSGTSMDLIPADTQLPGVLLRRDAANALRIILDEISAGSAIVPVSGYRSAAEQKSIYDGSLKDNGEEFTRKFVAPPHHSEHQTGLAIDLGLNKENIDFIRPDFPYEGICNAFRKIAPDYGFIERYPNKKEHITGIAHEPWHFRYVGYPHSEIMKEKSLVLEEYIDFIKRYTRDGNHLRVCKNRKTIEIFYVAADKSEAVTITVPKKTLCQVSGNNVDGFIVTVWRSNDEKS